MEQYSRTTLILANVIRDTRRRGDVSQATLGKRLGVSQALVSLLESGQCPLPMTAAYCEATLAAEIAELRTPGGAQRVGRKR